MKRQESHVRSILKGITWRFLATGTLILIVYLVDGSIGKALEIGAIEFVLKLLIYYGHERGWNVYLQGKEQTPKVSLFKTISWRLVASSTTFLIAYFVLTDSGAGVESKALTVVGIEFVAKFIIYYLHERAWQMLPPGSIRKLLRQEKRDERREARGERKEKKENSQLATRNSQLENSKTRN